MDPLDNISKSFNSSLVFLVADVQFGGFSLLRQGL